MHIPIRTMYNVIHIFHAPILIYFWSFPLEYGGGGDKGPTPILRHLYDLNIHRFMAFPGYDCTSLTTDSLATATLNEATCYHVSEMISTAL
jgi:hypothetical protein